jgi:transposase
MATTLGKTKKVQFFTFVLSRSRYKYILFSDTPFTTASVIEAHECAFKAIRGCPMEIVYDQDRLFIVDENLGDIIMTAGFRAYVGQSSFTTYFCRKADPESKGKVENVVKYVKQNFLYNRSFKDLETLNDEAYEWLARTANALEHGTTKKNTGRRILHRKRLSEPLVPCSPGAGEIPGLHCT